MRALPRRVRALALALCLAPAALAQETLAPPPRLAVEGVPPIASALAARLQPYAEFVPHTLVAWHPSRREILVQRRGDAATQLHVVTEPGVRPLRLAELPEAIAAEWKAVEGKSAAVARAMARLEKEGLVDLSPSADGRRIAFVQVVNPAESHIGVMEVASGLRRRITRPVKGEAVSYRLPRFSPDGRALFATSDRGSEWRRLVRLPLAGGAERALTAHHKFDVDHFEISPDAGRIAFTTNEGGTHSLRFLDLKDLTEQPRPPLFNGVIGPLAWRPKSAEVAFTLTGARTAGDVFSYDVAANKLARWTNGNSTRVNVSQFPEPRMVKWSLPEGVTFNAFHYPAGERHTGKRPVLVEFRGGPATPARADFLAERNYLLTELGVAVLHANARGATGFGKTFARLGVGPRRDETPRDVGAMLDWIRAQPDLDADRVVVAGIGPGAAMALAALAAHGNRIAGAIAAFPDAVPPTFERTTRPVLVIGGKEAAQLEAARAIAGRSAAAWRIETEGEGGGFARKAEADYAAAATVEFVQKVLLKPT